jgi:uncharacterized protein (TIGR03790 family)
VNLKELVMKKMTITMLATLGLTLGGSVPVAHAGTNYNDVAVIVNVNSGASQTIGAYFAQQRSIPAVNMIYVDAPASEEITDAQFQSIRSQVESHLQANNLTSSLNYIVTTKGVPLKINRGDTYSMSSPSASIESELMLVLGTYASSIGGAGRTYSPYYTKNTAFSRATYGFYLATRLDGYTTEDVLELIDRSGPGTRVSTSSRFVFDQDPAWNTSAPYLNDYMTQASTALQNRGRVVELNADSVYVTSRTNVVGYVSWGSNDHYQSTFTENAIPFNSWVPGAIAETYVSTSGRSFEEPPSYGQSLVADLIREGASGVKGYVYEPYSSSMANSTYLFDRYAAGFNLAESYYMASRYFSWMDVVVGDPKTTITFVEGALPVQLSSLEGRFDEASSSLHITWNTVSELNNYGFFVQRMNAATGMFEDVDGSFVPGNGTSLEQHAYEFAWAVATAPSTEGQTSVAHQVRLKQVDLDGTAYFSESIIIGQTLTTTAVAERELPQTFGLAQNYPNPFNPSTTIRYTIPEGGTVRLAVYNALGQEVEILVDGRQEAGVHEAQFVPGRSGAAASGMYYYRLTAGDRCETRSMVYVK